MDSESIANSARSDAEDAAAELAQTARRWVEKYPVLPLPGRGDTLGRWRMLAQFAASDVCLAKVLEAHYDALAILAELVGADVDAPGLWAVWAAEPPGIELRFTTEEGSNGHLTGTKAWCSGASLVDHALVTATEDGERCLLRLDLRDPGVSKPQTDWNAVGMSRIVSGDLSFDGVRAQRVGANGDYLARPGFWHGGAGISACWYGATCAIAETLRAHAKPAKDAHAAAHLGCIDMQLTAAGALLRELAMLIDAEPGQPHVQAVTRARSFVERAAIDTIDRVGRALGPGPLCLDRAHALRCADLTTFVRQSHAERDWESLGNAKAESGSPWTL